MEAKYVVVPERLYAKQISAISCGEEPSLSDCCCELGSRFWPRLLRNPRLLQRGARVALHSRTRAKLSRAGFPTWQPTRPLSSSSTTTTIVDLPPSSTLHAHCDPSQRRRKVHAAINHHHAPFRAPGLLALAIHMPSVDSHPYSTSHAAARIRRAATHCVSNASTTSKVCRL